MVGCSNGEKQSKPNVIILYADDLGYGDLSCYGADQINTPNIDQISKHGVRFTNGYATAATSTPSRYSLLTGKYPWKNKRAAVLPGNAPLIINTNSTTLPKQLKNAGYATAVIGKWHLGLGNSNLDWNQQIKPGPNEVGFDYSFVMASTNDRVPTVYVKNDKVYGLKSGDTLQVSYHHNFDSEPTGKANPELLKLLPSESHDMSINNGISRIGYMKGGKSAMWRDEDMGDVLLSESKKFIAQNKTNPFFLFYSFPFVHVPRTPNERFVGKSKLGARGDALLEMDYAVGEIISELKKQGLYENTILIFSSDNGPVLDDGYQDKAVELNGSHKPTGGLRGGKYSMFDAGAKVPFMVSWPERIKPKVSDALISQVDLFATLSDLLNIENTSNNDSRVHTSALLGESQKAREYLLMEGLQSRVILRKGDYVYMPAYKGPKIAWGTGNETGISTEEQLYNLKTDPKQLNNIAVSQPILLKSMRIFFANEFNKK